MDVVEELIKEDSTDTFEKLSIILESMENYKRALEKKLKKAENYINNIRFERQNECGKRGHTMVWEIEEGPYGQRYRYCKQCGL